MMHPGGSAAAADQRRKRLMEEAATWRLWHGGDEAGPPDAASGSDAAGGSHPAGESHPAGGPDPAPTGERSGAPGDAAGRGLVASHEDDLVDVDVRGSADDERHALGDVLGDEGGHALIDLRSPVRVPSEAND